MTLPSARRAVIVMALSWESTLMTARNELNEAVRAEEGIRILVAASSLLLGEPFGHAKQQDKDNDPKTSVSFHSIAPFV